MSKIAPRIRATRYLESDNATVAQVAEHLGVSKPCAWRCVRALKDMSLIHIARYAKCSSGVLEAVYAWGDGGDAPNPYARKPVYEPMDIPMPMLDFWHERVFAMKQGLTTQP